MLNSWLTISEDLEWYCALTQRIKLPPQPQDLVVSFLFFNHRFSADFVYQCAIFLIIKHEQCQIHSSEIKERPFQPRYFIFRASGL